MYNNKMQNITVTGCHYFSPFYICISPKLVTHKDSAVFFSINRCVQRFA